MERNIQIKQAVKSFFSYTRINKYKFIIQDSIERSKSYTLFIDTIPICNCKIYTIQHFCVHIFYILLYFFKIRVGDNILHKSYFSNKQLQNILKKRMKSRFKSIPTTDMKSQCVNQCSICMNSIPVEHYSKCPRCCHRFHIVCLDKWILSQLENERDASCPLCRHVLILL